MALEKSLYRLILSYFLIAHGHLGLLYFNPSSARMRGGRGEQQARWAASFCIKDVAILVYHETF